MIDGDISPINIKTQDKDGQIRVQTNSIYKTEHNGLIMQLKKIRKTQNQPAGSFDFFASDFREQWKEDAKEDNSLFED